MKVGGHDQVGREGLLTPIEEEEGGEYDIPRYVLYTHIIQLPHTLRLQYPEIHFTIRKWI
jgi:hypothetical protein